MKSVVEMQSEHRNIKTLNIILIGYGQQDMVSSFLREAKELLQEYLHRFPVTFYSSSVFSRAEGNPALLKNQKSAAFRLSRGEFSREYYGFGTWCDPEALWHYLYDSRDEGFGCPPINYFSPKGLSQLMHEKFGGKEFDSFFTFADVEVEIGQSFSGEGMALAQVKCCIGQNILGETTQQKAEELRALVERVGIQHSEVLRSGYISFQCPQLALIHTRVYPRYAPELCDRYLLGAEWYGYLGKGVAERLSETQLSCLKAIADVEAGENNISYTMRTPVDALDAESRKQLNACLETLLIPGSGIYSWSGLHRQSWQVCYMPRYISVYASPYDLGDHSILLANHPDTDEIAQETGAAQNVLLHSWVLKND